MPFGVRRPRTRNRRVRKKTLSQPHRDEAGLSCNFDEPDGGLFKLRATAVFNNRPPVSGGNGVLRAICGLFALAAAAMATSASAGELRREVVASQALGRDMPFIAYLPDGYAIGDQRYPVLYLLHGAASNEDAWVELGLIKERVDKLIAGGAIPPTLVIMPGCPGCWWIDGVKDKAETAVWSELVPAIDKRYRTIPSRDGRLIAGLSAGGYGAVRYALKYPERIAAVAALSPAIYADSPPAASSARREQAFLDPGGRFDQLAWTANNYPRLIDGYFGQPNRLPFYLASGDGDRFGIAFESALLFKRLFEKQPDISELRVVDGDHSWAVWGNAIDGAMRYLFRFVKNPQASAGISSHSDQIAAGRK